MDWGRSRGDFLKQRETKSFISGEKLSGNFGFGFEFSCSVSIDIVNISFLPSSWGFEYGYAPRAHSQIVNPSDQISVLNE